MKTGNFKLGGIFRTKCFDPEKNLKWETISSNLVVDEGLAHILDAIFSLGAVTPNANYYIGLIDATPTISANDTLTTHAGWVEVTDYAEATRQEYVETRASLTIDNALAKATFSMNATTTVGGAMVCSVDSGTAGLLLAVSPFATGDKPVDSGDTIEVQYDFSASST